jgi:hypothetical protein
MGCQRRIECSIFKCGWDIIIVVFMITLTIANTNDIQKKLTDLVNSVGFNINYWSPIQTEFTNSTIVVLQNKYISIIITSNGCDDDYLFIQWMYDNYSFNGCDDDFTHSHFLVIVTSYGLESVLTSTITYISVKTTTITLYIRNLY